MNAALTATTACGATIEQVLEYKHKELIARLQRKLGIGEQEAKELFEDTLRFLFLCAVSWQPVAPSRKIDRGWHEFLMYTRDYRRFCDQYLGQFVDHTPIPIFSESPTITSPSETYTLAQKLFGTLSSNWEVSTSSNEKCSADCRA